MELKALGIKKQIDKKIILKNVDLHLKKGDALALRGVNGSGKTTLIRILSGLDKDFSGEIHIFPKELKRGYTPQDVILFEEFTVLDNLKIFSERGRSKNELLQKIKEFSELFEMEELLHKRLGKLSGGQKRLVNLLCCLVGEADLLFLDEVIVGIDEDKVKLLQTYLKNRRPDKIMIITSHQEDFLKAVANVSAELINGELVFNYENQ